MELQAIYDSRKSFYGKATENIEGGDTQLIFIWGKNM